MLSGTLHARRYAAALLTVLAGPLALSACMGDEEPAPNPDAGAEAGAGEEDDLAVIVPGKPGEAADTVGPDDIEIEDPYNHADIAFVQMMIPHHGQALVMSELAMERAADPAVQRLAERIRAGQGPEILTMAAWLEERDIEVPRAADDPSAYDHGEHGHNEMQGMLTPAQMAALEKASGPTFDRLFLEGMVRHHEGAIAMAEDVSRDGAHIRINELAADVMAGQQAEIDRMRAMLAG